MNKKVYKEVSERASGSCELCGRNRFGGLELHHIVRRKVIETPDNCIMLCSECHRGTRGVHGREGHALDITLKLELQQKYFDMGYTEEEVRGAMGGKLY